MSQKIESFHRTFKAEATLDKPFRIVTIGTADNSVKRAVAATEFLVGVHETEATIGNSVKVNIGATMIVEAGGAVAKGARVTSDAQGRAVTAAATNQSVGRALEAASGAGVLIEVLLTPGAVA